MGGLSLTLNFNKDVLTYTGYTEGALDGIAAYTTTPPNGVVTIAWMMDPPPNPMPDPLPPGTSLQDGSVLINLNFNVTSSGSTGLTWDNSGDNCEYIDYPYFNEFDGPANSYDNGSVIASGPIDIGIYNIGCGDFVVKCKSELGIVDGYLTDILFAVKWKETDPNALLINAAAPLFTLTQQDVTEQSGGYNYATFSAQPNVLLDWTAGTEYTLLTFSHNIKDEVRKR